MLCYETTNFFTRQNTEGWGVAFTPSPPPPPPPHAQARTHARTHAHRHARAHARTHTYARTHVRGFFTLSCGVGGAFGFRNQPTWQAEYTLYWQLLLVCLCTPDIWGKPDVFADRCHLWSGHLQLHHHWSPVPSFAVQEIVKQVWWCLVSTLFL